MEIRATVVTENSVYHRCGLLAEHGWSVFIETPAGSLLFDTGQGMALRNNAGRLGLDLKGLAGIVLSHHHWDHTGGLKDVLAETGDIPVFAHPDLFKKSFRRKDGVLREVGIPFGREELERRGARFDWSRTVREVAPGILLTGEIPRTTEFESGDPDLLVYDEQVGGYRQDPLHDDQALVIHTRRGLCVLLGCSHAGLINTLNHIVRHTGEKRISTLFGGTHLGPLPPPVVEATIAALKEFDIERIGVSHCTGRKPSLRLQAELGGRFFFCNTGDTVTV